MDLEVLFLINLINNYKKFDIVKYGLLLESISAVCLIDYPSIVLYGKNERDFLSWIAREKGEEEREKVDENESSLFVFSPPSIYSQIPCVLKIK